MAAKSLNHDGLVKIGTEVGSEPVAAKTGRWSKLTIGFRALRIRNYRLYWSGQFVSQIGSWMQTTGPAVAGLICAVFCMLGVAAAFMYRRSHQEAIALAI